jgi:hypothetical protein
MPTNKKPPSAPLTEEQLLGRTCFIRDYARSLISKTKTLPNISSAAIVNARRDLDEAMDLLESLALQLSIMSIHA